MAKVTVRKETGRLVIDFIYRGVRCREQTALPDSAANRKRASAVLKRIKDAIALGAFNYADFFPDSALASRLSASAISGVPHPATAVATAAAETASPATPTFREFTATWLAEHQVEWRRSHIKVLNSTLEGHLLPAFGARPVGAITKSEIMTFRARLAELAGRAREKMSNKRINGILAPLRQILNEAADRFGFVSPCATLKPLRVRKTDIEPFTLDQVQTMVSVVRADYRDYFSTRFFTVSV